jgi:hypothetical protein
VTVANDGAAVKHAAKYRTECNWCGCRSWKRCVNEDVLTIMYDATRKRGEKATVVEKLRVGMKSASAESLVNGRKPSSSS